MKKTIFLISILFMVSCETTLKDGWYGETYIYGRYGNFPSSSWASNHTGFIDVKESNWKMIVYSNGRTEKILEGKTSASKGEASDGIVDLLMNGKKIGYLTSEGKGSDGIVYVNYNGRQRIITD